MDNRILDRSASPVTPAGAAVGLGTFDGLHLGHMSLINSLIRIANREKLVSLLYTFRQHPQSVLENSSKTGLLTDDVQKRRLIGKTGIDDVVFEEFDLEYANMTPEKFVSDIQIGKLGAGCVAAGYNYRFGRNGSGTAETLKVLGAEHGLKVHIIDPYMVNGESVSSTLIRRYVEAGEVEAASRLLGRLFSLRGVVIEGMRIGRSMNIPTANIIPDKSIVIPKAGVYATSTKVGGRIFRSVTNIGDNPTVGVLESFRAETHIIGFEEDIYGQEIEVYMHIKLRGEEKFDGLGGLKNSILNDISKAAVYFNM